MTVLSIPGISFSNSTKSVPERIQLFSSVLGPIHDDLLQTYRLCEFLHGCAQMSFLIGIIPSWVPERIGEASNFILVSVHAINPAQCYREKSNHDDVLWTYRLPGFSLGCVQISFSIGIIPSWMRKELDCQPITIFGFRSKVRSLHFSWNIHFPCQFVVFWGVGRSWDLLHPRKHVFRTLLSLGTYNMSNIVQHSQQSNQWNPLPTKDLWILVHLVVKYVN